MSEAKRRTQRRLKGGWCRVPAITLPAVLLALVSGCTTSSHRQAVQFDPAPRDRVGAQELEPVEGLHRQGKGDHAYSPLVVPNPLPEPVLAEIRELQNSYSGTFQRGLNRAAKYEGPLRARLCEAGLPEDLIWMAMVESMFQNKVVSPAGAGGMWQFIPSTARRYQLRMDSYVDERYNWERCTEAAIEYLKGLHDYFDGRWDLAITAYNMGEGGLSRAIAANGGETDFFKLIVTPPASDRIRLESKKYYPRLLAYTVVTANPEKYGFTRGTEPPDDVERVPVQGMYGLAKLNEALSFAPGTLEQLNPDLLRDTTPPSGEYRVAVPRQDKERFLAALQTVPTTQPGAGGALMAANKYKVHRNESVAKIASKFGVSQQELLAANGLKSAKSVRTGMVISIPDATGAKGGAVTAAPAAKEIKTAKQDGIVAAEPANDETPSAAPKTYKVRKGDTLAKIAATNKIPVAQLMAWNKIGKKGVIVEGQVLAVGAAAPAAKPVPAADTDNMRYHQVAPGEYPAAIAKLYGLKTDELMRMNGMSKDAALHAGEKLAVGPKSGNKPADPAPAEVVAKDRKKTDEAPAKDPSGKSDQKVITASHKVARGESIAGIAAKNGMKPAELMALNKLSAKSVIKEGQELTVRKPAADTGRDAGRSEVKVARAATTNAKGSKVVHTVAPGQNPTVIARQYGVDINQLYEWNAWPKNRMLQVGDAVVIYKKK
jgi:membrane-bound lytic murein transglycosylase D